MISTAHFMKNLCKEACNELQAIGYKKDIDPRTLLESFNLFKQADGQWFKSTKPSLHESPQLTLLPLQDMPALKNLTDLLNEKDEDLKKYGGRIFLKDYIVDTIKKGTQTCLLSFENTETIDGPYRKLCDEIIANGVEKDRFRIEETYLIVKTPAHEWSVTTTHENHSASKIVFDFKKMPLLKSLALKIGKIDPKFQSNGGRIFITPKRIYRLNNKIETVLKINI